MGIEHEAVCDLCSYRQPLKLKGGIWNIPSEWAMTSIKGWFFEKILCPACVKRVFGKPEDDTKKTLD